ncbi:hypothetical protein ScPMuIL_018098 [Solemya velum]
MEWARVQKDFWDWRMRMSPELSTYKGVYRYNDLLTPLNLTHFTDMKEGVDEFIGQLGNIDSSALSQREQMDFYVLKDLLQTFSESYKWLNYAPVNRVNFLEGPQLDADSYGSGNPFYTRGDFENYLQRLDQYPNQIMEIIDNFKIAVRTGHTLHNVSIARVPGQIAGIITSEPEQSGYFVPFNDTLENITTIPQTVKTDIRERAKTHIEKILVSLGNLSDYIQNDYLQHTRSEWGVGSWDNGSFYRACLKWHLSVDMTPQEVHDEGLREVERITTAMEETMKKIGFEGSIREFYAAAKTNKNYTKDTADEILEQYRRMLEEIIMPKLPMMFKDIPDRKVRILRLPYDGPGGMYYSGSEDGTRPGTFYANVYRPQETLTFNMMALLLHETAPGHHLQSIYSQTASLKNYRKGISSGTYSNMPVSFPGYTAYSEGWGLYSEYLGEEMGLYKDNYEMMGRYEAENFRACRLVIDTGLHMFNWTRERAVTYLMDHTAYGRDDAEIEIDRYITWPGQACAYKIGEIRIKKIRADAEQQLGDDFDIRDFHSLVLNSGSVPLNLLQRTVDEWVQNVKDTRQETHKNFWDWRMRMTPELSTYKGVYRYNDLLTPMTLTHFTVMKVRVDEFLLQLQNINSSALSRGEQMDFDVLKDLLQTFSESHKWLEYAPVNRVNFLEGPHIDAGSYTLGIPFHTRGDFENYLSRLEHYPKKITEIIDNFRVAVRTGHTLHNVSIARVPDQLDRVITSTPEQIGFFAPFNDTLESITTIPQTVKDDVRGRAKTYIADILTSLGDLRDYIQNEYLPHTRSEWGVGSWDNGSFYRACLKFHLSVEMTPQEVHDEGLREVERITTAMEETIETIGFNGSIKEFFAAAKTNKNYIKDTADEVLQAYRIMIEETIKPKLPTIFKDIPERNVVILPMPVDGPLGVYIAGSEDGTKPGIFYANVYRPQEMLTFNMMSLVLHETVPGHHFQSIYAQRANLKNYRKGISDGRYSNRPVAFPTYTAYEEGWGLYSEYLGEELNLYTDNYEIMGRYSFESLRACRLVVDTGLHVFNWTRERAVVYLMNHTSFGRAEAEIEIDRYITLPGQACAYKIGEIRIKQIRADAEQQLGDDFDIRDFHSLVLNSGSVPLNLLQRTVEEWVQNVKDTRQETHVTCTSGTNRSRYIPLIAFFCLIMSVRYNAEI